MADRMTAPVGLKLLVLIVNREKSEFYTDLLVSAGVNLQMCLPAEGTSKGEAISVGGREKTVIAGVIRDDRENAVMDLVARKFGTIRAGKGVAASIPLTGTVGATVYRFLSGTTGEGAL